MAANEKKDKTAVFLMLAIPTAGIFGLCVGARARFLRPILFPYCLFVLLLSVLWLGFLVWLFQDLIREHLSQRSVEREKKRHPAPQLENRDSFPMGGPHWTEEQRRKQQEIASEEQSRAIGAREAAKHPRDYGSHPPQTIDPKGDIYRLEITPDDQSTEDDAGGANK
jgi:hypothetical protein